MKQSYCLGKTIRLSVCTMLHEKIKKEKFYSVVLGKEKAEQESVRKMLQKIA